MADISKEDALKELLRRAATGDAAARQAVGAELTKRGVSLPQQQQPGGASTIVPGQPVTSALAPVTRPPAAPVARPLLEVGGTLIPGAVGTAAGGPALGIPLAGAGKAVAGAAADILEGDLPPSLLESAKRAGTRFGIGSAEQAGGEAFAKGGRLLLATKPSRFIKKGGGSVLDRFLNRGITGVSNAEKAGDNLLTNFKSWTNAKNAAYDSIAPKDIIPIRKSKSMVNELLSEQSGRISKEAKFVLNDKILEKSNAGNFTGLDLGRVRIDLGNEAEAAKRAGRGDIATALKNIKQSLSDDLELFSDFTGKPEIKTKMAQALKVFREGTPEFPGATVFRDPALKSIFTEKDPIERGLKLTKFLKGSIQNGNTNRVSQVIRGVGPEGRGQLQQTLLDDLLLGKENIFEPKKFFTKAQGLGLGKPKFQFRRLTAQQEALGQLFDEAELEGLQALARISQVLPANPNSLMGAFAKQNNISIDAMFNASGMRADLMMQFIRDKAARDVMIEATGIGKFTPKVAAEALITAFLALGEQAARGNLQLPQGQTAPAFTGVEF
jgi:hypothetical protein